MLTESEMLSSPDLWVEGCEIYAALGDALLTLPPRTLHIIVLRYWDGMILRTIGEDVGLSKERVRQIILRGMRSVRREMESAHPEVYEDMRIWNG